MKPLNIKLTVVLFAMSGVILPAAAAMAAEGGAEGEGSWSALIFYAINAALFVAIIVHYARPAVRQLFAARAHQVRERRTRAEAALAEAEALTREAIGRIEQLADEKARLLKDLEAETTSVVKQIRDAAKEGTARITRDAELTVAAAGDDARRRMRAYLAGVAGAVARQLVERGFNADDQRRMLDGFAEKLAAEARP